MKTVKIWHPKYGYIDADYDLVQKVKAAAKLKNAAKAQYERDHPSCWSSQPSNGVNIIDLAFRLFFFIFIALPMIAFCIVVMWWSFGMFFVYALIAMFVLVVLCYLSQVPASQLTFGFAIFTFIKAIVMTPIALIGSFFVAKAPQGTAVAGGIAADMARDAGEIIDKVKRL